jgi:ABC-type polysaccharide/polyol phosphate transport system ATPase subunit
MADDATHDGNEGEPQIGAAVPRGAPSERESEHEEDVLGAAPTEPVAKKRRLRFRPRRRGGMAQAPLRPEGATTRRCHSADADVSKSLAISVESISASYRVSKEVRLRTSLRGGFSNLRQGANSTRLVPALRDVSLAVPKGTVLGVLGRNGAGKSTLLRAIAGIIPPTAGRIVVRGEISALLSAGLGFNRELSGRSNIELGALAMGFPEGRIRDLTESVVHFAQLGEYLDFPMRTYSSGMSTRLGFALAAHLDPEVLLIDEALAGGDTKFKERVAAKMTDLCSSGRTIVVVSHAMRQIKMMASSCVWLHQGRVVDHGEPEEVITQYLRYCRLEASSEGLDDE